MTVPACPVYYLRMHEDTKLGATSSRDAAWSDEPIAVDSEYADVAAEVFSLLSDVTRIRIILALRPGEMSVNDLAGAVGKSPTAVSQHLAKLRWGRIVRARHAGNRAFYSLVDEHAGHLVTEAVLQAQHVLGEGRDHRHGHARPAGS